MPGKPALDPVDILKELEDRCFLYAARIPQQIETRTVWVGVGYRLADSRLVTPLADIVEILAYPNLSMVPRTKPWVRGVANVRGNLLPVMDLREYLEGTPVKMLRQSRVLVVNHLGILTGFVVDEVLGLKHFHDEDYSDDMCVENPSISGYVEHGFIKDGERWCVFNVHKLADSVRFVQAAG